MQRINPSSTTSVIYEQLAVDYENVLIAERDAAIGQLTDDMRQVHDLFKETQYLVESQDDTINLLHDNIQVSLANVNHAKKEIDIAEEYSRKSCCVLI